MRVNHPHIKTGWIPITFNEFRATVDILLDDFNAGIGKSNSHPIDKLLDNRWEAIGILLF